MFTGDPLRRTPAATCAGEPQLFQRSQQLQTVAAVSPGGLSRARRFLGSTKESPACRRASAGATATAWSAEVRAAPRACRAANKRHTRLAPLPGRPRNDDRERLLHDRGGAQALCRPAVNWQLEPSALQDSPRNAAHAATASSPGRASGTASRKRPTSTFSFRCSFAETTVGAEPRGARGARAATSAACLTCCLGRKDFRYDMAKGLRPRRTIKTAMQHELMMYGIAQVSGSSSWQFPRAFAPADLTRRVLAERRPRHGPCRRRSQVPHVAVRRLARLAHHPSAGKLVGLNLAASRPARRAPPTFCPRAQLSLYLAMAPGAKTLYPEGGTKAVGEFDSGRAGFEARSFRGLNVMVSEPFEVADGAKARCERRSRSAHRRLGSPATRVAQTRTPCRCSHERPSSASST